MKRSHLRASQASVETIIPWRDQSGGGFGDEQRKVAPFRPTTLADVEKICGRAAKLRWGPKRYRVLGVTGFAIDPASQSSGGGRSTMTHWSILDSANIWCEIERTTSRKLAVRRCRELNERELTHEEEA